MRELSAQGGNQASASEHFHITALPAVPELYQVTRKRLIMR